MKKKILVVTDYYLPGYKAGGPIRTLANLFERVGDEFQFCMLTSDRDLGDNKPYPFAGKKYWQPAGKAQVLYLSQQQRTLLAFHGLLNTFNYDLLFLNSFFSRMTISILLLRRLGKIPGKPLLLAPRGELAPVALGIKPYKKQPYILLAKWLGLYKGIYWQASTEIERQDILSIFGQAALTDVSQICIDSISWIRIAPDLPSPSPNEESKMPSKPTKQGGTAHIVFLSRITRKKNLDTALKLLSQVRGQVRFDIYGPIEDQIYWQECQALIRQLPPYIRVEYKGSVEAERVPEIFSQYHLFLFPTRSESFGYVILESLSAGCPVLISDQTPWCNLAEIKAGWDIPLGNPDQFHAALNTLISMDDRLFNDWSQAAREHALKYMHDPALVEGNRKIFLEAFAK